MRIFLSDTCYKVQEPPELKSRYVEFYEKLRSQAEATGQEITPSVISAGTTKSDGVAQAEEGTKDEKVPEEHFHAWVYIYIGEASFFIETTTGERKKLSDPEYRVTIERQYL